MGRPQLAARTFPYSGRSRPSPGPVLLQNERVDSNLRRNAATRHERAAFLKRCNKHAQPPIVLFDYRASGGEEVDLSEPLSRGCHPPRFSWSVCSIKQWRLAVIVRSALVVTQRDVLSEIRMNESALAGKKVLVIDDDLRNIFASPFFCWKHQLKFWQRPKTAGQN